MEYGTLFDFDTPANKHSKQAIAICEMVCKRLELKISRNTKIWNTACNTVEQIYYGSFLERNKGIVRRTDCFNYNGTNEKILDCKNDWNKVKQLFVRIIDNLHFATLDSYMPFKKDYLVNLTFSTFFGTYWQYSMLIYDLIQVPKRKEDFFQQEKVEKIKREMDKEKFSKMKDIGEQICKKYFSTNERTIYYFWINLDDMFRWWLLVKKFKSDLYADLKVRFLNQNLLEDYHNWLINYLEEIDGKHYQLQPWFYKVGSTETNRLASYFAMYIRIKIRECNLSNEIEKNICSYYLPESFSQTVVAEESIPDVEILTEEPEIIF